MKGYTLPKSERTAGALEMTFALGSSEFLASTMGNLDLNSQFFNTFPV